MSIPFEPMPNQTTPETEARIKELQALITDSQRRADKSKDEDIREALNLQVSKLGLKVARLRRGQPEELPSEVEKAIEDEGEPLPQPTPEQIEEADKLLQRSMLERRRGNKPAADDLLRQAAEAAPGAASVIEAIGDDLMARKQYAAAQEAYKSAHKADPKSPSIERKLAELSMTGMAGMSIEDHLRMGSFDSPFIQQGESMANPKVALILSAILPGSGQFAMGQQKKAIFFFSVFALSLVLFLVLIKVVLAKGTAIPAWAWFPIVITVVTWLVNVADASSTMKLAPPRATTKPNKPTPPVNLPFE